MRVLRRLARYLVMTLAVIVVVLLLAVATTQTGWFKDWLRRYIVREASQFLNGELTIGRLSGSLFYGVTLSDVALVQGGETVIALKDVRVDYSALDMISSGIVLDEIELNQPVIHARRGADGWNLMRLVKRQARERERTGPGRPITMPSIVIHDGKLVIDRGPGAPPQAGPLEAGARTSAPPPASMPASTPASQVMRIDDLDVKAAFAYAPVNFTIDIGNISFVAANPDIALRALSGKVVVAGDDIHLEQLRVRLPETDLQVRGVVRTYKQKPLLELVLDSQKLTFREIGVLLPAVRNIGPQPSFHIETSGPLDGLVCKVDVRTAAAGNVRGQVTFDITGQRRLQGDVELTKVNLEPWLRNKDLEGLITGRARFDLRLPYAARGQRFGGTYHFTGPAAGAYGYAAEQLDARGRFEGARVVVEQARARAYGAAVTGAGTVDGTKPGGLLYAFKGRASEVDLRRVPKQLSIPDLESRLDLDYDLKGRGKAFTATALFHPSIVEGASIAEGTRGHFEMDGRTMKYGGDGNVERLDLQRMGRALEIKALTAERFAGVVNGRFRVDASGRTVADLVLDADGVVHDTTLFGTDMADMAFQTKIEGGALAATAKGQFAGLDPRTLIDNEHLAGTLSGTVDGRVTIDDLRESISLDTFGFDGQVRLKDSTFLDVPIASGLVDVALDERRADIRQLTIDGPEVAGTASGALALDSTSASDVTYRFTMPDLAPLGRRLGQPLAGSGDTGGKLTGNLSGLTATGTAHAKALRYGDAPEPGSAPTATPTATIEETSATYTVTLPELEMSRLQAKASLKATNLVVAGREVPTLSAETTYANREIGFEARAAEGPRTVDAVGRAQLLEGRQDIRLTRLALQDGALVWQSRPSTEARLLLDGRTLTIEGLQLASGTGDAQRIAADGLVAIAEGTTSNLKIVAEGIDLAEVERLVGTTDPRLAGRLSTTATVTGTRKQPEVDAQFAITNGAFRQVPYQSLAGHAAYDQRRITLDVKLEQSPGTALTATGTMPLSLFAGRDAKNPVDPKDVVDLHVRSTPVDLGLIQGVTQAVVGVTGTMQLDMRVKGLGRDVAFEGYVRVDNGAFTVARTGAAYTGLSTTLQFEPSRLVVEGLHILDDGRDPLEVKGEIGLTGTRLGALNLTAQAKRFEVMHNELGEVDVNTDLRIQGELAEPRISGTVAIETGRVEVDRLLRRLTAGAYATEAATPVPGSALPKSSDPLAPTQPAMTPGVTQPPVVRPAPVGPAPATAGATGQAGQPGQPVAGQPATGQAAIGKPALAAAAEGSPLNRMHVDVRLTIPDNLILRGKDLRVGAASMGLGNVNVTVGGDLRLIRQPGTPVVVAGTVNTVRGTYDYFGRRFDILRDGRIAFQSQDYSNPALDVSAQRLIQPSGIEARIRIQGTARRPQLSFDSTPPMDESDILAMIVFNQPLSTLEAGQRNSLAQMAGETAAGLVVSPLTDTIGRALDLDLLEVGTTTTDTGGTGGTVTVGKQIDENLFFKFRQQFGSQEVSEFILEYQLARFLRLQASRAEGEGVGRAQRSLTRRIERGGIDLIFYFSY